MEDRQPKRSGGPFEPGEFPVIGDDSGPESIRTQKGPLTAKVTLKVNAEMTEEGKKIIRRTVAEVLQEAASGVTVQFASADDLATFVRAEVRKALSEELHKARVATGVKR